MAKKNIEATIKEEAVRVLCVGKPKISPLAAIYSGLGRFWLHFWNAFGDWFGTLLGIGAAIFAFIFLAYVLIDQGLFEVSNTMIERILEAWG